MFKVTYGVIKEADQRLGQDNGSRIAHDAEVTDKK